jgi:hypothetical protein
MCLVLKKWLPYTISHKPFHGRFLGNRFGFYFSNEGIKQVGSPDMLFAGFPGHCYYYNES